MDVELHNPTLHLALVVVKLGFLHMKFIHFNSNFDCKNNTQIILITHQNFDLARTSFVAQSFIQ